jgi:hypothetical protein
MSNDDHDDAMDAAISKAILGSELALRYQWMRGTYPIPGATGETYTPDEGDIGHRIDLIDPNDLAARFDAELVNKDEIWLMVDNSWDDWTMLEVHEEEAILQGPDWRHWRVRWVNGDNYDVDHYTSVVEVKPRTVWDEVSR